MSIEPAPKIVMQNKLRRSREKLAELMPLIQDKRESSCPAICRPIDIFYPSWSGSELNKLSTRISSYCADHLAGEIDDLTDVIYTAWSVSGKFIHFTCRDTLRQSTNLRYTWRRSAF